MGRRYNYQMRSMTGYGRGTATFDGRQIAVELSSVNRKQAEISLSLPRSLLELEPRVRDEINAHISRGRLTVAVGLHHKDAKRTNAINLTAAKNYRKQLDALRKELKLAGEITLDHVLRGPGVIDSDDVEIDTDDAWPALGKALKSALDQVNQTQSTADTVTSGYETGQVTDIAQVMLARQQSSVAFEATLQVRNKLLSAYQDIMKLGV